jgi:hypothetical protein
MGKKEKGNRDGKKKTQKLLRSQSPNHREPFLLVDPIVSLFSRSKHKHDEPRAFVFA